MNKYIDADKLIAETERLIKEHKKALSKEDNTLIVEAMLKGSLNAYEYIKHFLSSLQQEKPEGNKLPNKRTRVNYAICKLQAFKPLREAIVLDGYVFDEGKSYRENLINYINAIPESRLTEIRSYLKEKGWWPYADDTDWMEQERPEADWEKEINDYMEEHHLQMLDGGIRYDKRRDSTGN